MNKVKGYRNMIGYSQEEMAKALNIKRDTYRLKEAGERQFTQEEMVAFLNEIKKVDSSVTLDLIFLK